MKVNSLFMLILSTVFLSTNCFVIHSTPAGSRETGSISITTCTLGKGAFHLDTISTSQSALYAKKKKKPSSNGPISTNRQARRNYEVLSKYEAGICLLGSEIKAIRDGKMNLGDGYVRPDNSGRGMSLYNCHIGKHSTGEFFNHEERRVRPLLLTKEECKKLRKEIDIKGMTIVPLKAYFNDKNMVKVQIGLCRGKNVRDKRSAIKDREIKRDTDRMMKSFRV
jgi:SsrA-binding protein